MNSVKRHLNDLSSYTESTAITIISAIGTEKKSTQSIKERLLSEFCALDLTQENTRPSLEHLRVLIETEKQKRDLQGETFNCYAIDFDDLQYLKIAGPSSRLSNFPKRFQLIIHDTGHYSTVDVSLANTSCVLLDAANDPRSNNLASQLKAIGLKVTQAYKNTYPDGTTNNQQRTPGCCSIFAFEHAIQASKIDIHLKLAGLKDILGFSNTKLEKQGAIKALYWEQLPCEFLQNAQSLLWLDRHVFNKKTILTKITGKINPDLRKVREYIRRHVEQVPAKGQSERKYKNLKLISNKDTKLQNGAIKNLFEEYKRSAIELIKKSNENTIHPVIIGPLQKGLLKAHDSPRKSHSLDRNMQVVTHHRLEVNFFLKGKHMTIHPDIQKKQQKSTLTVPACKIS